jgi:hypothetical protein
MERYGKPSEDMGVELGDKRLEARLKGSVDG